MERRKDRSIRGIVVTEGSLRPKPPSEVGVLAMVEVRVGMESTGWAVRKAMKSLLAFMTPLVKLEDQWKRPMSSGGTRGAL